MERIRWGIIGAGKIARKFAADIRFTSNATLAAIGSRSEETARTFAQAFAIPRAHGSYADLMSDPEVDAVYIATPHNFHKDHALAAIRAGKPVLCEKPLTSTPADSQELVAAAHRHDVYLMEGLWSAFLPSIQQARVWLDEGRIGDIVQIRADFGFRAPFDPASRLWNPELAGGAMLDIGIYPFAFNRLMLGDGPDSIRSVITRGPTGVDAEVFSTCRTGDVTSVLTCSFLCNLANTGSVIGTKGRIELPSFWRSTTARLYENETMVEDFSDNRPGDGFEFEIEAASQDILDGRKQSGIMPHALSLALQDDMARAIES